MNQGRSIGGHESTRPQTDEWLTPPEILADLGPFDLDPCAPSERPWDMAAAHYTLADNGLALPWHGFVWVNPPYSDWKPWVTRLAEHGNGVALIFARTETRAFFDAVWARADAARFIKWRLRFRRADRQLIDRGGRGSNSAGAPSVLVAYGTQAVQRLHDSRIKGQFVADWTPVGVEAESA